MTAQHPPLGDTLSGVTSTRVMRPPRFSIILCTYNRRNLVLSALASLRRQTLPYSEYEVIVIDNGSADNTLSAVRTYVSAGIQHEKKPEDIWRVQCLLEPQNGLIHARHTGLLAASGEIAVFLDDDTIADPGFLEHLLKAYEETGADAIGGHVEIRWETPRPHWLTNDMLDMLGYFAPASTRTELQVSLKSQSSIFSNCCFSVKIEALRSIGYFSPFLSKRMHVPTSMEINDLCNRLAQAGYILWYEPEAIVLHRVSAARLRRPFFVGRAYWQGRSEILIHYASKNRQGQMYRTPGGRQDTSRQDNSLRTILLALREVAYLAFIHRPLLRLANRSTSERLMAAMEQARHWGHVHQRLQFLEHAPLELTTPAVLLVRSIEPDAPAELLAHALTLHDASCTQVTTALPLSWLWRHRAYQGRSTGIVHFYRPGAFELSYRQRQRLWFRLWLARCWGIRIVTTDAGGWWQSSRQGILHLLPLSRRILERKLLYSSDIVLAYTRQPEQLYPDRKLRQRIRCLPHPGFRGHYPEPIGRTEAHKQLGLSTEAGFVYLCFAQTHTERELMQLIAAFAEIISYEKHETAHPIQAQAGASLLLVGPPKDKKTAARILRLAALNPAIYLCMAPPSKDDIPLYMGAANAVVLPHLAIQTAGTLETALLALSYGRVVVVPSLPRFRGMLPPHASSFYDPASRESFVQALIQVQTLQYHMSEKEASTLDAESGWSQYAHRLLKIYQQLLSGSGAS